MSQTCSRSGSVLPTRTSRSTMTTRTRSKWMSMSASDSWQKGLGREARPPGGHPRATREAIQPSLWDRLVNDLPGLSSEIHQLRRAIQNAMGEERLHALDAGGLHQIDSATGISSEQKKNIHRLLSLERRQAELESR